MSHPNFDLADLNKFVEKIDAKNGLGTDLYETISQLTPSISVDLIINDLKSDKKLLTWRDDKFYGPGWHVPGGVLRFKELLTDRIKLVLHRELGVEPLKVKGPIGIHEMFNKNRNIRGHFLSLIYEVTLKSTPPSNLRAGPNPKNGQWQWFSACPGNLIQNQQQLRKYL